MEVTVIGLFSSAFTLMTLVSGDRSPISYRMGPIDFGIPDGTFRELLQNKEGRKPVLSELYYENCGSPKDKGKLMQLTISPTKTSDAIVTASGRTEVDLLSPIVVNVAVQKLVLGVWVTVPCYRGYGSCSYEDFCRLGARQCPIPFITDNGLPCRCPVRKGTYSVNQAFFQVPRIKTSNLLVGNYKGRVEIFYRGERFACYNGTFAVDESPN